jgi:hypothetical protein
VRTAIDAVLAALEALRRHLLPSAYRRLEDHHEAHEAHEVESRTTPLPAPVVVETPWGPGRVGGGTALR